MMESLGLGTDEQESTTAAWAVVSFSGYESRFSTGEWTRRRWGRTRRAEAMWGASRVKAAGPSDASGGSADASALVPPHLVDFFSGMVHDLERIFYFQSHFILSHSEPNTFKLEGTRVSTPFQFALELNATLLEGTRVST
jgi:hypothetical protein